MSLRRRRGPSADLAVSGGPDSLGLLLLALEAGLVVTVHHVDHHARPTSARVTPNTSSGVCRRLAWPFVRHDVVVEAGANFEARARSARRATCPDGVLTGHTMDDLAETVLLNMLRGAGLDGLSPMVNDPTKPLRDLRRAALHDYVAPTTFVALHDETNDDPAFRRNRVRHEVIDDARRRRRSRRRADPGPSSRADLRRARRGSTNSPATTSR